MTWTPDKQERLNHLLDKEVNGGGLQLAESRECAMLECLEIVAKALKRRLRPVRSILDAARKRGKTKALNETGELRRSLQ